VKTLTEPQRRALQALAREGPQLVRQPFAPATGGYVHRLTASWLVDHGYAEVQSAKAGQTVIRITDAGRKALADD
jgi:hypothetical protein